MTNDSGRDVRIVILILVFCVAVLAAYLYEAIGYPDPDQFWHLATGRYVVQNHVVPTTDVFSWWGEANHREWVAQEWLFGVVAFGAWTLAGFKGLYLLMALLEGAVVLLVYALARARGVNPLWSFLIMVASLFGTLWYVVPRPQVVTFALVLLTALLLQKGKWWWALPVVVVGVNMHGGIWPLYVLMFAYYEFPKRWWLVAAAAAVTLINPNPIGVLVYPFQAFANPSTASINEFQPTALWSRKADLAMYLAVLLAVQGKKVHWRDGVLAIGFVLLSLSALRHIQWFYVLVLPFLAPYIAATGPELATAFARLRERLPARLRTMGMTASAGEQGEAALTGVVAGVTAEAAGAEGLSTLDGAAGSADERAEPAAVPSTRRSRSRLLELVLVGALVVAGALLGVRAYRTPVQVDYIYPQEMVPYLKLHKITKFFNAWHDGGYLIWAGVPPMVDGRGDPFVARKPGDKDLMKDSMDTWTLKLDPHAFMEKYGLEYAMVPGSAFLMATQRDPSFTWVKQTSTHVLLKFDASKTSAEPTMSAAPAGVPASAETGRGDSGNEMGTAAP